MKKIRVESPAALAQLIRNTRDEILVLARDIHRDAFDFVFSKAIGSEDEELNTLQKKITKNRQKFINLVSEKYDFDFELSRADWFNEVIMPATKI